VKPSLAISNVTLNEWELRMRRWELGLQVLGKVVKDSVTASCLRFVNLEMNRMIRVRSSTVIFEPNVELAAPQFNFVERSILVLFGCRVEHKKSWTLDVKPFISHKKPTSWRCGVRRGVGITSHRKSGQGTGCNHSPAAGTVKRKTIMARRIKNES